MAGISSDVLKHTSIIFFQGTVNFWFYGSKQNLKQEICKEELINPLNAELNPICHLLALLGSRHILHISMIRVNQFVSNQVGNARTEYYLSTSYQGGPLPSGRTRWGCQTGLAPGWCIYFHPQVSHKNHLKNKSMTVNIMQPTLQHSCVCKQH